jgi:hypothetical protein
MLFLLAAVALNMFFFACPKKNEKRAPAINYDVIAGRSLDLTVVLL